MDSEAIQIRSLLMDCKSLCTNTKAQRATQHSKVQALEF